MVSLKDIAAACGVSTATVSKALNDLPDIGQERERAYQGKGERDGIPPELGGKSIEDEPQLQHRDSFCR